MIGPTDDCHGDIAALERIATALENIQALLESVFYRGSVQVEQRLN